MHHGRQADDSGGSNSAAAGTAEDTDPQSGSSAIDAWSAKVKRYLVSLRWVFSILVNLIVLFFFTFFLFFERCLEMSCMEV